jgi:hypothetical protein
MMNSNPWWGPSGGGFIGMGGGLSGFSSVWDYWRAEAEALGLGGGVGSGLGEPGYQGSIADRSLPPGWTPDPAGDPFYNWKTHKSNDPFYSALNIAARQTQEPWIFKKEESAPRGLLAQSAPYAWGTDATNSKPTDFTDSQNIQPAAILSGATFIDRQNSSNGDEYGHYRLSMDGVTYDAYLNDSKNPNKVFLVPASESAPAVTGTAQPKGGTAPTTSSPTASSDAPILPILPTSAPDWTTQTEWRFPAADPRLIQPINSLDTGNRPLNFVVNKVLMPWRNALAFAENIPLATLMGIDDALKRSVFSNEYEAAQVMMPLARSMGLAMEVGPALAYANAWMSTSQRVGAVTRGLGTVARAPAYAFVGAGGVGAGVVGERAMPTLGPVLETSLPSLEKMTPSLAEEANTRFLQHVQRAQQFFAEDPSRIQNYGGSSRLSRGLPVPVSPGQLGAASRRSSFADLLAGNAMESRVFESILTHPEDYALFDQLSGAGRIDFVGIGRFEGFTFELTSLAGVLPHSLRAYMQEPGAFIFSYSSLF